MEQYILQFSLELLNDLENWLVCFDHVLDGKIEMTTRTTDQLLGEVTRRVSIDRDNLTEMDNDVDPAPIVCTQNILQSSLWS